MEEYELVNDYRQLNVGLTNSVEEVTESGLRLRLGILSNFCFGWGFSDSLMMMEHWVVD